MEILLLLLLLLLFYYCLFNKFKFMSQEKSEEHEDSTVSNVVDVDAFVRL